MNTVVRITAEARGYKPASSAKPMLEAAAPVRTTYRRSTTTKAPRKRTFVNLYMEKYNPGSLREAGAGGASFLVRGAAAPELITACYDGGNNGNNNGRGAGFGGNNNGDANSSNNGGNGPAFQPSLMSALGLAAALAVVSLGPLPASASALQRVVPTLQQRQQAKKVQAKKVQQEDETGPIYHGQVQLSERERRMLSRRQLHFREVIRAERV